MFTLASMKSSTPNKAPSFRFVWSLILCVDFLNLLSPAFVCALIPASDVNIVKVTLLSLLSLPIPSLQIFWELFFLKKKKYDFFLIGGKTQILNYKGESYPKQTVQLERWPHEIKSKQIPTQFVDYVFKQKLHSKQL